MKSMGDRRRQKVENNKILEEQAKENCSSTVILIHAKRAPHGARFLGTGSNR